MKRLFLLSLFAVLSACVAENDGQDGGSTSGGGGIIIGGGGGNGGGQQTPVPGDVDRSYGTGGVAAVTMQIGPVASILQPDGKLLIATTVPAAGDSTDFALLRFRADGTRDSSFGTAGSVVLPRPDFDGILSQDALAVDGSGRILLAGLTGPNQGLGTLLRFTPEGALDTSFGQDGRVTPDPSTPGNPLRSVLVLPDGKLLVISDTGLHRLLINGAPDTSFGTQGAKVVSFAQVFDPDLGHSVDAVANPQRIVAHGSGTMILAFTRYGIDGFITVLGKLDSEGNRDPEFSGRHTSYEGVSVTSAAASYDADLLRLRPDGGVVLAESTASSDGVFPWMSTVETTDAGVELQEWSLLRLPPVAAQLDDVRMKGIAIQGDGKVVAALGLSSSRVLVARYLAEASDGFWTLDSSFGVGDGGVEGGRVLEVPDRSLIPLAVHVDAQGRILVITTTTAADELRVTRLFGN